MVGGTDYNTQIVTVVLARDNGEVIDRVIDQLFGVEAVWFHQATPPRVDRLALRVHHDVVLDHVAPNRLILDLDLLL